MSKLEDMPIEKAGEVIERFGGIRPMAKKIDVAVTTIQGWKKRDVIPAARYHDVVKAAATHDVDLSDLLAGAAPVNQNTKRTDAERVEAAAVQGTGENLPNEKREEKPDLDLEIPVSSFGAQPSPGASPAAQKPYTAQAAKKQNSNFGWLSVALIVIAMCAVAALFWPQSQVDNADLKRLSALEQEMKEVKEQQSFLGTVIPENLDEQIASLKEQAQAAQATIGQAVEKAEEISNDVLGENAGTIEQRYMKLQSHVLALASTPELKSMAERLDNWGLQPAGQARLNTAVEELNAVISGLGDVPASAPVAVDETTTEVTPADESVVGDAVLEEGVTEEVAPATVGTFEMALQAAREQSLALNQTFEGVPQEDLKAAALLLGLTQFRSSLGRDNEAFADDLKVLTSLMGEDNAELKASLEKLAPYSEQGVLTPAGLSKEFKTMAGDAVVASLKGEDVSLAERAKARINEVMQVEKNGKLVSGTETQAQMATAEQLLNAGDLEGAIAQVEALQGPAAEGAQPWLNKAQATLMAQRASAMLQTLTSSASAAAASAGIPIAPQRIHNEESGINILKQNTLPLPAPTPSPTTPKIIKMPKASGPY